MDKFIAYLNALTGPQRRYFANEVGSTLGYFRKAACRKQQFRPQMVVAIEMATHGRVCRQDFHPDDYRSIWPELP
jgi:hypothetical protein